MLQPCYASGVDSSADRRS